MRGDVDAKWHMRTHMILLITNILKSNSTTLCRNTVNYTGRTRVRTLFYFTVCYSTA